MRDTRIQKAMADMGLCSRRQAEQIILEGRVKLNGRPVQLGDKMDIKADILSVDGERVFFDRKKEYYYYMMNKPRGYRPAVSRRPDSTPTKTERIQILHSAQTSWLHHNRKG